MSSVVIQQAWAQLLQQEPQSPVCVCVGGADGWVCVTIQVVGTIKHSPAHSAAASAAVRLPIWVKSASSSPWAAAIPPSSSSFLLCVALIWLYFPSALCLSFIPVFSPPTFPLFSLFAPACSPFCLLTSPPPTHTDLRLGYLLCCSAQRQPVLSATVQVK